MKTGADIPSAAEVVQRAEAALGPKGRAETGFAASDELALEADRQIEIAISTSEAWEPPRGGLLRFPRRVLFRLLGSMANRQTTHNKACAGALMALQEAHARDSERIRALEARALELERRGTS